MQRQTTTPKKPKSINFSLLSRGILQRKCVCGNQSAGGGECGECGKKNQLLLRRAIHLSEPGDRYEQEADRIADEVMRMPEPRAKHQVESEKEGVLQRKVIADSITPLQPSSAGQDLVSEVPPIVDEVLRSPGQLLDTETRNFMESRFGRDFSQVRVHTDANAAESARAVNAIAYTVGQDVIFGQRYYQPHSSAGKNLIAHELTHSLQQKNSFNQNYSRQIQRQTIELPNGHKLGEVSPSTPDYNLKYEVELVLHRLLDLWSITVEDHDNAIVKWLHIPPDNQIPDNELQPLKNAISKNEEPTLANIVANHYLGLQLETELPNKTIKAIGKGKLNDPKDLAIVKRAFDSLNIPTNDADLASGIKSFKQKVASGTLGLQLKSIRKDEIEFGADRFAGQTFIKEVEWNFDSSKGKIIKFNVSIFVPKKAPVEENFIHIFFTPNEVEGDFKNTNDFLFSGIRAESDQSKWISIVIPGRQEGMTPNWLQISTVQIQSLLSAIGRINNKITAIRLSAHSRGHRGLEHTISDKDSSGNPLIDRAIIEKIVVFDASYQDVGKALTKVQSNLKNLLNKQGSFDPEKLVLYDVTTPNISGINGRNLPFADGFRAIGYVRNILDAMARKEIKSPPKKIMDLVDLLNNPSSSKTKLPPLGSFSSKQNPKDVSSGKISIFSFIKEHVEDIKKIVDPINGLPPYINSKEVKLGYVGERWHAHHYFAAEFIHEVVESS